MKMRKKEYNEKIIIIEFGRKVKKIIERSVREENVY